MHRISSELARKTNKENPRQVTSKSRVEIEPLIGKGPECIVSHATPKVKPTKGLRHTPYKVPAERNRQRSATISNREIMETQITVALLIDAENASAKTLDFILSALTTSGKKIGLIRAYADWTMPTMKNWRERAKAYAIDTVQRFASTKGKNTTDMLLVTDAIQILYTKKHISGICFVSSDGDYSYTAQKIRDEGYCVIGAGRKQTPTQFITACEDFIFTDTCVQKSSETDNVKKLIDQAFNLCKKSSAGYALVSDMGNALKHINPAFNKMQIGFTSLGKFITSVPGYELVADERNVQFLKQVA